MGWSKISSIGMGVGNLLLVKCSQALSSWIKKFSFFCFCKFLCLLYVSRICFRLKRAKTWLEFSIKLIFNQYSIRSFQRAFVGVSNLWIQFIFRKQIECLCLKCPRSVWVSGKSNFLYCSRGNCIFSFQFPFWYTLE